MEHLRLLESGIYTIPQIADLVEAPQHLVRIWVSGHSGKQTAVIENELGKVDGRIAVSFANLMELRFVATFWKAGVRLQAIRAIMDEVRRTLDHPHPFATSTVFRTDGRKIVAEIAQRNGVENIYDLHSQQYEMYPVVKQSLKGDVKYDPHGEALYWRPRPDIAPNVILHPKFSFGRPILEGSHIPTETLAQAVRVEGSARVVALQFDVPEKQVREAKRFEEHLRRAA